ncbi:MAG: glutamine--tRNA ligase/YqeY domain fusion protein [Candidatus Latescibacteria bacterium]|nr:glutamine--tRNA ligase/YqeY domain fusion protein [Candidatus Latescibacterota bacterium]
MTDSEKSKDFIRTIIDEDIRTDKYQGRIVTRFPPEPNAYLHIGHAKAFCINYGIAEEYGGQYNLRFDDTNPLKEETEFVEAIKDDIRWLGFDWKEHEYYASDYFEQLYDFAMTLIKNGRAYVDDLSADDIRSYRGTPGEPGRNSPFRDRSIDENLDLLARMRSGEYEDGARVLRAKIDMSHPNLVMRDPTIYRIRHAAHHRTDNDWCIYPMYDFTHCLSDSIEGITHSLCSMEFENNRVLYDWFLDELKVYHPQQIEFARGNVAYTITSKRKLRKLIEEGHISAWNDPRMPTLTAMKRRGYPPEAIRSFWKEVGVAKKHNLIDFALLEFHIREKLNRTSPRVMGVINPLKIVIDNYPDDQVDELEAVNNPEDETMGSRKVPFSKELYIERDDFMEDPPKKFYRLAPGREVRLRYAYFVTCTDVIKDPVTGEVTELRCTYDPETRGGDAPDGRKVKSTLHWVSANHALKAEVRLFDRLFNDPNPDDEAFIDHLNPDSLKVVNPAYIEPSVANAPAGFRCQFERLGYFCVDTEDSKPDALVFNRTVTLRDTWAKMQNKG